MNSCTYLIKLNFKVGKENESVVKNIYCLENNIITLKENKLAYITYNGRIQIINLETQETTCLQNFFCVSCISMFNNKILIGTTNEEGKIYIFDKDELQKKNIIKTSKHILYNKLYTKTYDERIKFPKIIVPIENDNIVVVDTNEPLNFMEDESYEDVITIRNINTLKCTKIITSIKEKIESIVYLGNNYIAVSSNNKIIILNTITGLCAQIIEFNTNFILGKVLIVSLDNERFLTMDNNSNIQIYE